MLISPTTVHFCLSGYQFILAMRLGHCGGQAIQLPKGLPCGVSLLEGRPQDVDLELGDQLGDLLDSLAAPRVGADDCRIPDLGPQLVPSGNRMSESNNRRSQCTIAMYSMPFRISRACMLTISFRRLACSSERQNLLALAHPL
jgi:hypothetical protein